MQRCEKQVREDIHYFLPSSPLPFVVEMCGISYCDGTYRQERVNSPICVLEYVAEGTGTVIVEGVAHTASAGDVYLLPMGSSHRYFSDGEHPWTKLFINAWGPVIPPLLTAYGLDGQVVFPSCPLEGLFRDLFALSGGAGPGGLPQETVMERCALKFHEILMGLSACLKGRAAPPDEAARLKNLIDSRLNQTVTIRELAEEIYRSEDYTIKLFKRHFGRTPHDYAAERKAALAVKLLTETRLPVAQIAAGLGYEDPQYFSHAFRRQTGLSPSACRKNAAAPKGEPPHD